MTAAVHILNRKPAKSLGDATPLEKWFLTKPDVQHMKAFGSPCVIHIPRSLRGKGASLARTSVNGVLIGYDQEYPGKYKVYVPSNRTIYERTSIYVNENLAMGENTILNDLNAHDSGRDNSGRDKKPDNDESSTKNETEKTGNSEQNPTTVRVHEEGNNDDGTTTDGTTTESDDDHNAISDPMHATKRNDDHAADSESDEMNAPDDDLTVGPTTRSSSTKEHMPAMTGNPRIDRATIRQRQRQFEESEIRDTNESLLETDYDATDESGDESEGEKKDQPQSHGDSQPSFYRGGHCACALEQLDIDDHCDAADVSHSG